jgi:hypothetical protein
MTHKQKSGLQQKNLVSQTKKSTNVKIEDENHADLLLITEGIIYCKFFPHKQPPKHSTSRFETTL